MKFKKGRIYIMTNKKRIITAFITVMMLFSVFSVYAFAANPINDYDYNLVSGYKGQSVRPFFFSRS